MCVCVCVCVCVFVCVRVPGVGGGLHMPRRRRTPGTFARAYLLRPNGPSPPLGVKNINRGTAISSNKLREIYRFGYGGEVLCRFAYTKVAETTSITVLTSHHQRRVVHT